MPFTLKYTFPVDFLAVFISDFVVVIVSYNIFYIYSLNLSRNIAKYQEIKENEQQAQKEYLKAY